MNLRGLFQDFNPRSPRYGLRRGLVFGSGEARRDPGACLSFPAGASGSQTKQSASAPALFLLQCPLEEPGRETRRLKRLSCSTVL
ncbi:hypothetical protein P7K49_039130 [Saguinus oedipus]|uniref:Uncharacterized protein n=1 Tax=Saguinus oedipus TaxID=9490 RepID=A0ABQ9TGP4_SAGOE|nr:hypothetical protein P7K49_039130 [Saguinus oedipus]